MTDRQWRDSPGMRNEVDSSRIGDYGYKGRPGGVPEWDSGRDDCYDSLADSHEGFLGTLSIRRDVTTTFGII